MTLEEAWQAYRRELEASVNKQSFDTWIRPLTLVVENSSNQEAVFAVPNKFFVDWIQEHYADSIQENLRRLTLNRGLDISFEVQEVDAPKPISLLSQERRSKNRQLQAKYVFANFVVGASNQFAHAASRKVAEQPGEIYNPFFIYGGVGLGKTHLLNAIGNAILDHGPHKRIAYLSSEMFTNEVINSIRYDKMAEFRNRFRTVDILLIDDIQFIAGKERTQEEFFHTFNTLYEENKQIVISSDRSTKELADVELRLRSRFEMGLMADIQPPDLETRIAILNKKAEADHLPITSDLTLFLATHIKNNIRELEGSLLRLNAFSSLTGRNMTVDLAREVLRDTIRDTKVLVSVDHILKTVADRFQMKTADLKSKRRTKTVVYPRQLAMYLCRTLTDSSFPEIGREFGGKDHSTVIHAVRLIADQIERDHQTKSTVDGLIKAIHG
ncbi:MAG: chromosomal replication initiator protein DnaA [Nitrospirota bacterium]